MKKVNKNFTNRPKSLTSGWVAYDRALTNIIVAGGWPANPATIYRSQSVKDALFEIYGRQCAFCNQVPKGSPLQVEHYRPKAKITNVNTIGYYWLGYEWTNLLFACGNCNTSKGNYFPLHNPADRVVGPTILGGAFLESDNYSYSRGLRNEKPLLINPEIHDPDEHMYYDPTGKLVHLTLEGKETIDKYALNRDELYRDGRKLILDNHLKKLARALRRYSSGERDFATSHNDLLDIINEDILNPIGHKESFDHFLKILLANPDLYVVHRFAIQKEFQLLKFVYQRVQLDHT